MITKLVILCLILSQTVACIAVPETVTHEQLTFHYFSDAPQPMSYADMMCCYDCTV